MRFHETKKKKRLFGFDGGFYVCTEKFFDILALSFIWFLCCLPIITIGAATTALYYTVVKSIKDGRGYFAEEFFKAFRLNLLPGTFLWLVIAVLSFVFQVNIGILLRVENDGISNIMIIFYLFLLAGVSGIFLYGFPALARFDMKAGWIIKLSLYMTIRYFFTTLRLAGIFAVAAAFVYYCPYLILLVPVLSCILSSGLIEKVLINHMPQTK